MLKTIHNHIDAYRPVESEVLECYQNKLPDMVQVNVGYDKNSKMLFAKFTGTGRDELFTQARNLEELEDMVNDAIFTYYEIPHRYARLISINKRYTDLSSLVRTKQLKIA